MLKNKKGDLVWREVVLWVIALAVLALVTIGIFLFKDKGINLLDSLKNLLRFR